MRALYAVSLAALALAMTATGAQAQPTDAERAGLRYLQWPGKAEPHPTRRAAERHSYARPAPRHDTRAAPQPADTGFYAARLSPVAVVPVSVNQAPQVAGAPDPAPLPAAAPAVQTFAPQSIYDAPPVPTSAAIAQAIAAPPLPPVGAPAAMPAVRAMPAVAAVPAQPAEAAQPAQPMNLAVNADDSHPRRYSLHREYGEQPDHMDMPQQVMVDHIDLAQPPEHEPTAKELRQGKDAAADPDAPHDKDDGVD
jgi:hypothetical protein